MGVHEDSSILTIAGRTPHLHPEAFVAAGARVIGDVSLAEGSSVWYNAVLRADGAPITIGPGSNLQDNVSVHVDVGSPVILGEDVSVGHNAVVHGCTIGDGSLIGMGAVVLNGARIGAGCLVAGGAIVLEGSDIPPGSLVAGVPATVKRSLDDHERRRLIENARRYRQHAAEHERAQPADTTGEKWRG